jgi:hypothetical protein
VRTSWIDADRCEDFLRLQEVREVAQVDESNAKHNSNFCCQGNQRPSWPQLMDNHSVAEPSATLTAGDTDGDNHMWPDSLSYWFASIPGHERKDQ